MSKKIGEVKKTSAQRFGLKVDKIISLLIQMKPLCDDAQKKSMVYSELKTWLTYQEELEKC